MYINELLDVIKVKFGQCVSYFDNTSVEIDIISSIDKINSQVSFYFSFHISRMKVLLIVAAVIGVASATYGIGGYGMGMGGYGMGGYGMGGYGMGGYGMGGYGMGGYGYGGFGGGMMYDGFGMGGYPGMYGGWGGYGGYGGPFGGYGYY